MERRRRRTSFRSRILLAVVEHDVIPLDGADMFQQGGIDSRRPA
jgi:hypothetical protein